MHELPLQPPSPWPHLHSPAEPLPRRRPSRAGNQSFLALSDVLHLTFVEGFVCMLKYHPIQEVRAGGGRRVDVPGPAAVAVLNSGCRLAACDPLLAAA